jgi:hypothetical protein
LELVFTPTGSKLVALAADAAGNAGSNHITASHTEAWGIQYEAGVRSYEEMTPPPGRFYGLPALRIVDSYAGFEGESKTWHELVDRGKAGKRISKQWPIYLDGGLMLFHMTGEEARERCYRGGKAEAKEYYAEQQKSLRPNTFTRMHSNERTAAESTFLPVGAWDDCKDRDLRPLAPGDRTRLVLGADASTSRDFTSLVGTIYNADLNTVDVKLVKVWKPKKIAGIRTGKPTIDLSETIGAEVLRMHKAGQVDSVVCDPYQLHTLIIEWEKAGIRVIELAQNSGRVESDQALYDSVMSKTLRHYGDADLNEAIKNAVAVETPRGFRLAKEKTSKKIDAAVALSMSCHGALKDKSTGGGAEVIQGFILGDEGEYRLINGRYVDMAQGLDGLSTADLFALQREQAGNVFGPGGNVKVDREGQDFGEYLMENNPDMKAYVNRELTNRGVISDPREQKTISAFLSNARSNARNNRQ